MKPDQVAATGPGGRLLKEDVLAHVRQRPAAPAPSPVTTEVAPARRVVATSLIPDTADHRAEEVKPLSMLRRTIAARLVAAQQSAALLTTFQ